MLRQLGRRSFGTLASTPSSSHGVPFAFAKSINPSQESKGSPVDVVDLLCEPDNSSMSLKFRNGNYANFSALWLRDNCPKFAIASHRDYAVPGEHDAFQKAAIRKDGTVVVDWADGHFSLFPPTYLHKWSTVNVARGKLFEPMVVSADNPAPEVEYSGLEDPQKLYEALRYFNDFGVVIIKGCPTELTPKGESNLLASSTPTSLLDIMAKFAEVPAYIPLYGYGSDYLLGTTEKNETQKHCPQCFCNIPKPIEMHQDFAYFNDVPGLFYNFCMRVDEGIVGGTNTCMDAYHVAERLRQDDPESFQALSEISVTFAKTALDSKRPVKSSVDRPIIRVDKDGEILDVIWSLMYLRTQHLDAPTLDRFAKAREAWKAAIQRAKEDGYEVLTPMATGDCTILNNKRMMHARTPFTKVDGVRQFYQTYGQEGLFRNRLKVMEESCLGGDVFHVHRAGAALSVSAS